MFNTINNRQSPRNKNLMQDNPTANAFMPLSKCEKRRKMLNKYRNLDLEGEIEAVSPDKKAKERIIEYQKIRDNQRNGT